MLDCFRRADLFGTSSVEGGTPIGISKLVGSRRCPLTLLTDEGIALIRLELIELSDVVGDLGVVLPPLDANRRHDGDNGLILALSDEFFDGAAGDPASPCEADDHSRYRAHDHSRQPGFTQGGIVVSSMNVPSSVFGEKDFLPFDRDKIHELLQK